jgi:glutathione S-transferase
MLRWLALYPAGDTGWFVLARWPGLRDIARAMETRPSALAAAMAEGLGPLPFSRPVLPTPPEGSAT